MDNKNITTYRLFNGFTNLLAFTTTKQSIAERTPRYTGDSPTQFLNSRKQLAKELGLAPEQLLFPRQTHTNNVVEVRNIPISEIDNTDALITNLPGICICIQTADCVPVLLFDPVKKVVAAVHAGWRGTVKKIVAETISKMGANYQTESKNIVATIGVSIGPKIYEVGDEVINAVRKTVPNAEKTVHLNRSGKYHFNLWEANRQILIESGVNPENIETTGECSFEKSDKYFSARRNGIDTGRMATGIMLKY